MPRIVASNAQPSGPCALPAQNVWANLIDNIGNNISNFLPGCFCIISSWRSVHITIYSGTASLDLLGQHISFLLGEVWRPGAAAAVLFVHGGGLVKLALRLAHSAFKGKERHSFDW